MNAISRVLLQSCKPSLHTNVDCTALVAAIVSRQVSVVRLLLEVIAAGLNVLQVDKFLLCYILFKILQKI